MTCQLSDDLESGLQPDAPRSVPGDARYVAGVTLMVSASLSFAAMAAAAKAARVHLQGPAVVLVRSIVLVTVLLVWMRSKDIPIRSRRPLLHARALLGALGLNLYYFALGHAPLGEVVVLANAAPLYLPFLGLVFLGERARATLFLLLFLGFLGVIAIALPGGESAPAMASELAGWGLVAAAGTGFTNAAALVCVKRLTADEHPLTIVFAFAAWSLVLTLPAALWIDPEVLLSAAGPLVLTAIAAITGQVLITYSLSCAPASVLMVFNYVGVVFSFLIGFVLWGEEPSMRAALGALLIVVVCVTTTRFAAALVR